MQGRGNLPASFFLRRRPVKLLFLCTHNACRSVLCEVMGRKLGGDRLQTASAGSAPAGRIHPLTLRVLQGRGFDTAQLASQGIDELEGFAPDAVVTVCDSAARESCPIWLGDAIKAHWGLPDPSHSEGTDADKLASFDPVLATIERRIKRLLEQPFETMERAELAQLLHEIGEIS